MILRPRGGWIRWSRTILFKRWVGSCFSLDHAVLTKTEIKSFPLVSATLVGAICFGLAGTSKLRNTLFHLGEIGTNDLPWVDLTSWVETIFSSQLPINTLLLL